VQTKVFKVVAHINGKHNLFWAKDFRQAYSQFGAAYAAGQRENFSH
jgi:hypothetical protein